MNNIWKIVIAILIVVIVWNILKGLIGLLFGVALAGLLIYGGMKLLEGPKS